MSQLESAPPDENRETNVPRSCAPPTEKERLPHSILGILSFAIAILAYVVTFLHFAYGIPNPAPPDRLCGTGAFFFMMLGVFIFFLISFVALICGLNSLSKPHTRKVFAILGICLSAPPVALCLLLLLITIIPMMLGL